MNILYLQPGPGIGGSKISLYQLLQSAPPDQISQVALTIPPEAEYEHMLAACVEKFHYLELPTWNKYRRRGIKELLKVPFSHAIRLLSLLPAVIKLASIIKQERIDLVHTNNGVCAAGAFAARLANVPHVWHIREAMGTSGAFPLILGDRLSALLFQHLSNVIVCNSQFTANFFLQKGVSVEIIHNGLNLQSFEGAQLRGEQLRRQFDGGTGRPMVAMVGNLTTRMKKHDLFLEVVGKLSTSFPECRFVIFGGEANLDLTPYTRELEQTVKRLGIEDRVVWADFINDIPAIMYSLDILVHPASTEGSGRVVMEAMAAARPVVGVKSGGVQELIQHGLTGFLVPPDDVDALAEKVSLLLEHPQSRKSMGLQAGAYARSNFSSSVMMASIVAVYRDLLS